MLSFTKKGSLSVSRTSSSEKKLVCQREQCMLLLIFKPITRYCRQQTACNNRLEVERAARSTALKVVQKNDSMAHTFLFSLKTLELKGGLKGWHV